MGSSTGFRMGLMAGLCLFKKFENIFPLANSFVKGKMLGAGWHPRDPSGEYLDIFDSRLGASLNIPNYNICETRQYLEFTATNRMSVKNMLAEIYLGPKLTKSAI